MTLQLCLSPRYRLDDESPWLERIDPSRHYWLAVNGNQAITVAIPGLVVSSLSELQQIIRQFRALQPGEELSLSRAASTCSLKCVSSNCYAIESEYKQSQVWHLFDQETLESLLMTAHPDWQCREEDINHARELLTRSWQISLAA